MLQFFRGQISVQIGMLFKQLDKLKRNVIMSSIVLMFIGNSLMFILQGRCFQNIRELFENHEKRENRL